MAGREHVVRKPESNHRLKSLMLHRTSMLNLKLKVHLAAHLHKESCEVNIVGAYFPSESTHNNNVKYCPCTLPLEKSVLLKTD